MNSVRIQFGRWYDVGDTTYYEEATQVMLVPGGLLFKTIVNRHKGVSVSTVFVPRMDLGAITVPDFIKHVDPTNTPRE